MPEGDTVLYYCAFLNKEIKNTNLLSITGIKNCKGYIKSIDCKGKLLYINIDDFYIHIHFGLTGYFDFEDNKSKYEIIAHKDNKNIKLYLNDNIKLSSIQKYTKEEHENVLNELGFSIFDKNFTLDYFKSCFKNKKNLLCSFLLNQKLFCGIGNFIKNEVLYLTKLDIYIKVNELNDNNIKNLYNNILFVSYSSLYTELQKYNLMNYLDKKYECNKPDNIEIPYEIRIYKQTQIGKKKVNFVKIAGRGTYYIDNNK